MSGARFRQDLPNFGDHAHRIGPCQDCASARRLTSGRLRQCWYCQALSDHEPEDQT